MDLKSEEGLLTLIANFGFENGWMTEIENLQINTKATLDLKNFTFLEVIRNAKCDENAARLLCALRCVDQIKLDHTQCSDSLDEDYYLFKVMSNLFTKSLVTKKQKLVYENRLRKNRVNENAAQKEKLEEVSAVLVKSDDPQRGDKINPPECLINPMLIDLVIKCLLQYLNVEDVKNVRYVSQLWSSFGLDALKARSKIEFSKKIYSNCTDHTPLNFFSAFPIEKLKTFQFAKFSFGNQRNRDNTSKTWAIAELDYFFRNHQKHIKELDIDILQLTDKNGHPCDNYDISSWIQNSAMTKPNTEYNTKFIIREDHEKVSTKICVQLSVLVNIKELRLWNCGVNIQEGILIASPKIEFSSVRFDKNGKKLTQICVNDIIDFTKAKEVYLTVLRPISTKMILDMGKSPETKLESLTLTNITLENIGTCRWNVNHLHLDNYTSFTQRPPMKVKELTIANNYAQVDISILPKTIEKLTISETRRSCICSQTIVLHNLKIMKLHFLEGDDSITESVNFHTVKCPQLNEFHLIHYLGSIKNLDVAWIPQTLKTLKLKNICINDEGINYNLNLDKLILVQYNISNIGQVCGTKVKTKELVLFYERDCNRKCNADDFLTFLNSNNICHGLDKRIYVGRFNWGTTQFEGSLFKDIVDKKADYYLFENNVGKAIDFAEFRKTTT